MCAAEPAREWEENEGALRMKITMATEEREEEKVGGGGNGVRGGGGGCLTSCPGRNKQSRKCSHHRRLHDVLVGSSNMRRGDSCCFKMPPRLPTCAPAPAPAALPAHAVILSENIEHKSGQFYAALGPVFMPRPNGSVVDP